MLFLTIFSLIFMLLTAFSDAGIIPKNDTPNLLTVNFSPNESKKVVIKGYFYKARICNTCKIVKPVRSNHCHDCNNCVDKFDHHCPWLGQCIGRRNYLFFIIYSISLNLLHIVYIAQSIVKIQQSIYMSNRNDLNSYSIEISKNVSSLFLIVLSFFVLLFGFTLIMYHIKLIIVSQTTRESLRNLNLHFSMSKFDLRSSNKLCFSNVFSICKKRPASRV